MSRQGWQDSQGYGWLSWVVCRNFALAPGVARFTSPFKQPIACLRQSSEINSRSSLATAVFLFLSVYLGGGIEVIDHGSDSKSILMYCERIYVSTVTSPVTSLWCTVVIVTKGLGTSRNMANVFRGNVWTVLSNEYEKNSNVQSFTAGWWYLIIPYINGFEITSKLNQHLS